MDFENTVDRGSAVNFGADSGLCLSRMFRILDPKRNLDHRSFFSLGRYVNDLIQIISVFEQSSFKLMFETVIGIVLCYSHQACCPASFLLHCSAKLLVTMPFTFTSLDVIVVSDFKKSIGGSTDLAKTRHGSPDSHNPIHPRLHSLCFSDNDNNRPLQGFEWSL